MISPYHPKLDANPDRVHPSRRVAADWLPVRWDLFLNHLLDGGGSPQVLHLHPSQIMTGVSPPLNTSRGVGGSPRVWWWGRSHHAPLYLFFLFFSLREMPQP